MKTLILTLLSLLLTLSVSAQTNTNTAPTVSDWTESIKRVVAANPDAFVATNLTVLLAPSYAPGIKDENGELSEFGVTAAFMYPLGKYAYAGARLDYLAGDYFMPSLGVELKYDLKLFGKVNATVFGHTGVSYPVSGTSDNNEEIGSIYGGGLRLHLFEVNNVRIGAFGSWEAWSQFPGTDIWHGGVSATFSF